MEEWMIKEWQRKVAKTDEVYILGDFSFHRPEHTNAILRRLTGQKFLIKGNHDSSKNLKKIEGFAWVKDYYEMRRVKGELVIMSHYPFHVWRNSHHGSWHLHGHSHGSSPEVGRRLDVGVDNLHKRNLGSLLISYEDVRKYMEVREPAFGDYHVNRDMHESKMG